MAGPGPYTGADLWNAIQNLMNGFNPGSAAAGSAVSAANNGSFGTSLVNNGINPAAVGVGASGGFGGVNPGSGGGGMYAPFGENGAAGAKGPPMWLAKLVLQAYKSGNTAYEAHLLADPGIAGNPHLANFVKGVFAGNADKINEANYYATNPSYNGWNNAAGDGIPGDGM